MKAVRAIAILSGILFVNGTTHAQVSITADGDATLYSVPGAPQAGGYGIVWGGTYGSQPGWSLYDIQTIAVNAFDPNDTHTAPTTYGNGKWNTKTGTLPSGKTYFIYLKSYWKDPAGNIVRGPTLQSNNVLIP